MTTSQATESITLRDVLAGQALTGLITAPARPGVPKYSESEMALAAYRLADEMLKARDA